MKTNSRPTKDKLIQFQVDAATQRAIKKAAEQDNRSVAQFIRVIVEKALAASTRPC